MRRLTTEQFIEKARLIHGYRYDYSLVKYTISHNNIIIICREHGEFEQKANSHLNGRGCVLCGYDDMTSKSRYTKESFIDKAKKIHGDKYDYSLVDYKNNRTKVVIKCPVHDIFEQTPYNHLKGQDCKKCGFDKISKSKTKTTEQFIKDAELVHGKRYIYDKVVYIHKKRKVIITCTDHGDFLQTPDSHIQGTNCPKCSIEYNRKISVGWTISNWQNAGEKSNKFHSFKVYVLKCYNNTETFYKVGKTFTTVKERFNGKKQMPYKYDVLNEFIFDNAEYAHNKEVELKRINKSNKYKPKISFGGQYECFSSIKYK